MVKIGTNFYAHWTPPGSENVFIVLHICKRSGGWPPCFDGRMFRDFDSWEHFLRTSKVQVFDEYSEQLDVEHFLSMILGWLEKYPELPETDHLRWLDPSREWTDARGFRFFAGDFR